MPDTNEYGVPLPGIHDIGSIIDGGLSSGTAQLQFPSDQPKYYTSLDFYSYTLGGTGLGRGPQGSGASSPTTAPEGSIILPLPIGLTDKHTVKYDEKPIVPYAVRSIIQQLGNIAGLGLGTLLSAYMGLSPNYFQTIMFDRPEYKRHELQFKLAPRSYAESVAIRNIITELNKHTAPDVAFGGTLFRYPHVVKVIYHPNSGFLYKFQPAVITDLIINYNGGAGSKAFSHDSTGVTGPNAGGGQGAGNNPPESVEVTIHMWEIVYWTQAAFNNQNDQTGV